VLLPEYWLARFWLHSRYAAIHEGIAVLREVVQAHPAFLLARGYLAEVYYATGQFPEALAAFDAYLQQAPAHPWLLAQIGRVSARLGRHDAADDWTREALAADPGSLDLEVQLVSRDIDAGKLVEAEARLTDLLGREDGRRLAIVWLRRGYLRLLRNDAEPAHADLAQALALAQGPRHWYTRSLAHYNVARLHHKAGRRDDMMRELALATSEGYPVMQEHGRDKEVFEMLAAPADVAPRIASPLPFTAAGEVDARTAVSPGAQQ
jgi:tetratricopeptide (TPR) repeat protein